MARINNAYRSAMERAKANRLASIPRNITRRRLEGTLDWSAFHAATSAEEKEVAREVMLDQYEQKYGFHFTPYAEVRA